MRPEPQKGWCWVNGLMVHAGGWDATLDDLRSAVVPEPTKTHVPVPYPRFVEEVKFSLQRFGLTAVAEQFALGREGQQMFGVLQVKNGTAADDWGMSLGLRSSYDKSLALSMVAGSKVFVCDNLAFSGEVHSSRKHTSNVLRDLPGMVYDMLERTASYKGELEREIAAFKLVEVSVQDSDHLMVEAVRKDVIPASDLPRLMHEWDEPKHDEFKPRTAWSLFNAFTEVAKRRSPGAQIDATLRLSKMFREEFVTN